MLTKNIEKMKTEVAQHIDADAVIQGVYWAGGRGCFIGCLTHSNKAEKVTEKFNMPTALVRICEHIFEHLSAQDAKQFFADIPHAIGSDGKNLGCVVWKLLEAELRALPKVDSKTQSVIDSVIDGMVLLGSGKEWPDSEKSHAATKAAAAAYAYAAANANAHGANARASAASAATYAAKAAHAHANAQAAISYAATATTATYAANAAAADFAAYGATYATYATYTYADATKRQRDTVLDLIKKAPVEA